MILDSSAIVAILCREEGHQLLVEKMGKDSILAVGAPTVLEAAMVLTGKLRQDGLALVHEFTRELDATISPFTEQHASLAYAAFLRYGKGRHAAALNFGDCLSYALAQASRQPLLYVGEDFAQTDVKSA